MNLFHHTQGFCGGTPFEQSRNWIFRFDGFRVVRVSEPEVRLGDFIRGREVGPYVERIICTGTNPATFEVRRLLVGVDAEPAVFGEPDEPDGRISPLFRVEIDRWKRVGDSSLSAIRFSSGGILGFSGIQASDQNDNRFRVWGSSVGKGHLVRPDPVLDATGMVNWDFSTSRCSGHEHLVGVGPGCLVFIQIENPISEITLEGRLFSPKPGCATNESQNIIPETNVQGVPIKFVDF